MSGDTQKEIQGASKRLHDIPGIIMNTEGFIVHPYVSIRRVPTLGRKPLEALHGIVIHQTGGANIQSALDEAAKGAVGAHFYVDKDGSIYQVASLFRVCSHVGYLKPRCLMEHRCSPEAEKRLRKLYSASASARLHGEESRKDWPDRYPKNEDSVGIELVGSYSPRQSIPGETVVYDTVTDRQNISLRWLVNVIAKVHSAVSYEIFRHPDISRKMPTEASTARW